LQAAALAARPRRASGEAERAPDVSARPLPLREASPTSPLNAVRGEVARLDAAYGRALRRAVDARDAESISSRFAEADRLQRQMLAASRRLRAEFEAEEADARASELPDARGSTLPLDAQASWDDAA
jgi:hypothetical protein